MAAPAQSENGSLPALLAPASPAFVAAHLTGCLTLVRPVGMTDDQAEEWLSIAAQDLAHYPEDIIVWCCAQARRVCRHHSEIVPKMIELCDETIELRRRGMRPRIAHSEQREQIPAPPLDMDWINGSGTLQSLLRKIGLENGHLLENGDGTVREA